MSEPEPHSEPESSSDAAPAGRFRLGPRIALTELERQLGAGVKAEGATWRGWMLGLLATGGIAAFIPYADFVMRGTPLSFNAFPMLSVTLVFGILLTAQIATLLVGKHWGLTRQDLTLVFCMTMVTYTIPGVGFWAFWSTGMTGGYFHARPENGWVETVQPFLTAGFFPMDPASADAAGPRPVEWFYTGLPPGQSVPWEAWAWPYARWLVVVALMYGLWFSIAGLLSKRWSDQERLPFPVAQVPFEMFSGYGQTGSEDKPFLKDRIALWGIGITLLIHSWNSMSSFYPNIPELPLMNPGLNGKYLTEPPWSQIGTLHMHIFPSIVGLTFLLSLEVAFSLWFFYGVMKLSNLIFAPAYGQGVVADARVGQGSGALLMLVLVGLWAARGELGKTLRQALGRESYEAREGDLSPRSLWAGLVLCFAGTVAWLYWFGVGPFWAITILLLFVLVMIGLARLIAEAGVFAAQFYDFPIHLLNFAASPAALGQAQVVRLFVWDRIFTADWFRIVPLPGLLNALHLSGLTGLRKRTVFRGMGLAIMLTFGLSFFTFLNTVYTKGGANTFGWFFNGYPQSEFGTIGKVSSKVEAWEKKQAQAAQSGKSIPPEEIPKEARSDTIKLTWIGVGGLVMAGFTVLRRFIFWWPHPAGYVMWMAWFPHDMLWFSFFLGWLFKFGISKYGGMRVYSAARRFFIGMVVGEALAAVLWVLIFILKNHREGHVIRIS
ncbi:MAG: hypothetical protein HS116_11165 [Planctomycetes bacterium]|nr:hypothetical protein [Planctomycetota bacterium]